MDLSKFNPTLLYATGSIFALLLAATLFVVIMGNRLGDKLRRDLIDRIKSWWIMAGIFSFAIIINPVISILFFAFMSFLALKEYFTMIPTRRADRRVLLWAYLTIPIQYALILTDRYGLSMIFIPIYAFLMLPMRMVLIGDTKNFLHSASTIQWGIMSHVFCLSHIAQMLKLSHGTEVAYNGATLVLFLVVLTQLNDVMQYISGKLFGKRKVAPKVSPNKTWAGLLGGIISTTLLATVLVPFLTPISGWYAPLAGLLISLAGFIGDIVMSALKRDLGVKDTSSLIPGHGGILDRIDSLIYTAPLFFHFVRYLYFNPQNSGLF